MMSWHRYPILCLYRAEELPWRKFFDELLIQEGYLSFRSLDLDAVGELDGALDGAALVVVSAGRLTEPECERLARHVRQGGRVILLRPPAELIESLGLPIGEQPGPYYRQAPPAYIRFCDHPWASHHAQLAIQCHAPSWLWRLGGAREIAQLCAARDAPASYATIVEAECGGGRVAIFWFDPATAIVRARQGDPLLASTGARPDADLDGMFKTSGLLLGQLDYPMHEVPQADVLADVVVGVIRGLTDDVLALPRVWHLPDDAPAMTLLDGDSDGFSWDSYDGIAAAGAASGVPYTVNMLTQDFQTRGITHEQVDGIFAAGNDLELHYKFATTTPKVEEARQIIPEQARAFREYTGGRPAVGARGHCVLWPGYTEVTEALAAEGIILETSFCPPRGLQYGYGTGSGRAARMVTLDGESLPVLQQACVFMDDMLLSTKWLAPPRTLDQIPPLIDRTYAESVNRYHGVINTCVHAAAPPAGERGEAKMLLLQAVLDATRRYGAAALTVRDWVAFQEARRQLDLYYDGGEWHVGADTAITRATIHRPANSGARRQGLTWSAETIDLQAGADFRVENGSVSCP